jgi:hypothetical protein
VSRLFGDALEHHALGLAVRQLIVVYGEATIQPDPSVEHRVADECSRFISSIRQQAGECRFVAKPRPAIHEANRMIANPT